MNNPHIESGLEKYIERYESSMGTTYISGVGFCSRSITSVRQVRTAEAASLDSTAPLVVELDNWMTTYVYRGVRIEPVVTDDLTVAEIVMEECRRCDAEMAAVRTNRSV